MFSKKERIEKIIANYSHFSRSEVKKLIKEKRIKVNDVVINELIKIDIEIDQIKIDDIVLNIEQLVYFLMNKPKGVICSHDNKEGQTIYDILDEVDKNIKGLNTFGRLDKDTTGLILISNDGKLNHELTSSKKEVWKTYLVTLNKNFDQNDLLKLEKGIVLDGKPLKESKAKIIENNKIELEIQEGKYHQVKRMLATLNYDVIDLHRTKFDKWNLDDFNLKIGEYVKIKIN
ncbi:pseudouridine synthase [Mycoplasmopsis columbina]|uniref:Pseudouridine synthase n=1 Tax=Mycoplasmopsis columbina SF7 TaxID=1037410 RepID=F9UK93_9BACT|nr:pseudouridine synthase [Mycoplasmopsis columbina]EGV00098.1 16S rRNA uridine-516 pseudouridylate synthase family protein [Mycoplasmopsis columbina SF7]VEU76995.1 Pseudouridine synthase [Mycoplasmopsis columbina]